jgi:tetratricopeptide (TPR) repeat protein
MNRVLPKLLVAATLCMSARALADGPKPGATPAAPASAKAAPDRADELFEQGAAAYDAGRLPEAQTKLEQAWALKKTHDIAGNLGVVELKLGKYPQAAEHLAWALQHFPPTEADQAKRGFEKQLAKARAEVGALRVRVSVDGAEVTVNGRAVGATRCSWRRAASGSRRTATSTWLRSDRSRWRRGRRARCRFRWRRRWWCRRGGASSRGSCWAASPARRSSGA